MSSWRRETRFRSRAGRNLEPLHGAAVQAADDGGLPFRTGLFDLVASRHPTVVVWPEIARVLAPGGGCLSQQVGAGSNRDLTDFLRPSCRIRGLNKDHLPGSAGRRPPSASMARAMSAAGLRNPKAIRVMTRILVLTDSILPLLSPWSRAA